MASTKFPCSQGHQGSLPSSGPTRDSTIDDNILVYSFTLEEHHENLKNCLQKAKERGVRLRIDKSTIYKNLVHWLGRVLSDTRGSASTEKIETICKSGRPETVEEVRSLMQACSYNAKFTFDHKRVQI